AAGAPEETRPLVSALNGLLEELALAASNQQRFLANAAHQLRTPLAGLQAHTELALAQPLPESCRAQIGQGRQATIPTARLASRPLRAPPLAVSAIHRRLANACRRRRPQALANRGHTAIQAWSQGGRGTVIRVLGRVAPQVGARLAQEQRVALDRRRVELNAIQ